MDYLCYTLEESVYVRENSDAQRMVIDTMKEKLCGKSQTIPRRSTLGHLLCVGGSIDATKGCNTIDLYRGLNFSPKKRTFLCFSDCQHFSTNQRNIFWKQ